MSWGCLGGCFGSIDWRGDFFVSRFMGRGLGGCSGSEKGKSIAIMGGSGSELWISRLKGVKSIGIMERGLGGTGKPMGIVERSLGEPSGSTGWRGRNL